MADATGLPLIRSRHDRSNRWKERPCALARAGRKKAADHSKLMIRVPLVTPAPAPTTVQNSPCGGTTAGERIWRSSSSPKLLFLLLACLSTNSDLNDDRIKEVRSFSPSWRKNPLLFPKRRRYAVSWNLPLILWRLICSHFLPFGQLGRRPYESMAWIPLDISKHGWLFIETARWEFSSA